MIAKNAGVCENFSDLLLDLGLIPASRVPAVAPFGRASVSDLLSANRSGRAAFELVDGTLVERAMGWQESVLAAALIEVFRAFVIPRNLGVVTGADGIIELFPLTVQGPDVSFICWSRLPSGRLPEEAVPRIAPDLVAEVLSLGNTRGEMTRTRREYFQAGVGEVWMIDPREQSVAIYSDSANYEVLVEEDTINCRGQLAGLAISIGSLFAELDRTGVPPRDA